MGILYRHSAIFNQTEAFIRISLTNFSLDRVGDSSTTTSIVCIDFRDFKFSDFSGCRFHETLDRVKVKIIGAEW